MTNEKQQAAFNVHANDASATFKVLLQASTGLRWIKGNS